MFSSPGTYYMFNWFSYAGGGGGK